MVSPVSAPSPRWSSLLAVLALIVYASVIGRYTSPVAAGSDSAGYLLSAKLLTEGRLSTPLRTDAGFPSHDVWEFTPLGMIFSERMQALIPTYPIGLPLFYAAAGGTLGWTWGPVLVALAMACGAVVFTVLAARELGVERAFATLAGVALAVCPLVIAGTVQPMSDTASTCWNAAAVWCALRARRDGASLGWSIASGAALAVTVLIRPANLLLLPVLALLLGDWRRLLSAGIGGLPGAVFLGWYQHALYGSVLVTGYGSVWGMFGSEHVAPALHKYLVWVPAFLPISVGAGLLAAWLPWRTHGRELIAFILWVLAYGAFYAFYPPTHEHRWYLRFILPMFPALAIVATLGMQGALARLTPVRRSVAAPALLALLLGVSLAAGWHHWRTGRLGGLAAHAAVYREIPLWAEHELPREAFVVTQYPSCSFYFYTGRPIVRSDVLKPERFAALKDAASAQGRSVFAIVTRADDEPTLRERLPGTWREIRRFGDFGVWMLEQTP